MNPDRLKQAQYWIVGRDRIRVRKESGAPAPWTDDPVLASTRWCNVRRMDDKVSKWLMDNYYHEGMKPAVAAVAAAMARLFNRPETLQLLCPKGYSGFRYAHFKRTLDEMREARQTVFTGVYIINGVGANGRTKAQYVLDNLRVMAEDLRDSDLDTASMQATHAQLMKYPGLGSFLAGQVVADLRHVVKGSWSDKHDWAPAGPGSLKGLSQLHDIRGPELRNNFRAKLAEFRAAALKDKEVRAVQDDRGLEAHDWQNVCCESSKYFRLLSGGRSKNRYYATSPQLDLL